jgi:hypothetical protein
VPSRIFGPKRDETRESWRKMHNEEDHNFYSSPNIIRVIKTKIMRWVGHEYCMEETRNASREFMRNPEGERPPGRHRRVDNIKTDL